MQREITEAMAVRPAVRARSRSRRRVRASRLVDGGMELLCAVMLTTLGCGFDTAIYGMYFPSWIVAPVVGAGLAALSLSMAGRTRLGLYLPFGVVLIIALSLIYAVVVWALFFDA